MRGIEIACVVIVALYVALRLRAAGGARVDAIVRLVALACAAWTGEDSVIRAYGFYGYTPTWSVFLDRVPLLIVCIWPVVIDSAYGLARQVVGRSHVVSVALVGGAIVLADASLIEPIAVHAGLWSWTAHEPRALFDVPLVGVLGWSLFAAAAIATLEALDARKARAAWSFAIVLTAPAFAHASLVAAWWAVFRWFGEGVSPWAPAVVAWVVLAAITVLAWRVGKGGPLGAVMGRAPGAAFFFALLAVTARSDAPLVAYALAFAPPYVALLIRGVRHAGTGRRPSDPGHIYSL